MNWLEIVITAVGMLGAHYGSKWVHWQHVKKMAEQIVSSPNEPITDPREALKEAVIRSNMTRIEKGVRELDRLVLQGKVEARDAAERGKRAAEFVETTIVEPPE